MKNIEKKKALDLRRKGMSMNEIVTKLGVAKSSVSLWVRDVVLTDKQKKELSKKGRSKESIEKRRMTRLTRENARRQIIIDNAKKQIKVISKNELFWVGVSLYIGEGSKKKRGTAELSNSDPAVIKVMKRFFEEICNVDQKRFRGHVHIHPHLDIKKAEKYWSNISRISRKQFYKTSIALSKSSKGKKDSLPYGTFSISVNDTILSLTIKGWMEGILGK